MVKGFINENLEPIISIGIYFSTLNTFDAIIDTGFNGYISIPEKIIKLTSWIFIGHDEYELADGKILKEKVYLGEIIFNGKVQKVYVLSNKTKDILIGTKLLINKILVINFKTNKLEIN